MAPAEITAFDVTQVDGKTYTFVNSASNNALEICISDGVSIRTAPSQNAINQRWVTHDISGDFTTFTIKNVALNKYLTLDDTINGAGAMLIAGNDPMGWSIRNDSGDIRNIRLIYAGGSFPGVVLNATDSPNNPPLSNKQGYSINMQYTVADLSQTWTPQESK